MTTTDGKMNFCKNVISLNEGDILFFDTNVIFDYLIGDTAKYNEPISKFIEHAIENNCKMYISPIVANELLHTIAKELFARAMIANGRYRGKIENAKRAWHDISKDISSRNINLVKTYNEQALELIRPLTEKVDDESLFIMSDITSEITEQAYQLSSAYGLNSTDAFITAHSKYLGGTLVSLDKDIHKVPNISLYYGKLEKGELFDDSIYE